MTLRAKTLKILGVTILMVDMVTIMSSLGRQGFVSSSGLKFSGSIVLVLKSISAKFQPPEANASWFFGHRHYLSQLFRKN